MNLSNSESSIKELLRRAATLFTPPERLKTSEWAPKYRRLSAEASSKGGLFSFTDAPWQREVLDAPDDPDVLAMVLMWCSQLSGKTETINNLQGKTIDIDPCPFMMVLPTLELAKTWSKDRFSTMLRDSPRLRGKVKDPRGRQSNNTLLHKRFPGGQITIAGANSAASLASRPIRKLFLDEVDRYPASAGTEGDPIKLAEKRTESFPDAVKIETSTPTLKGLSRIEKDFELSDRRYWFCPCPKCNHWQTLKWSQVDWTTHGTEADPRYICENCKEPLTDAQRQAMVRAGEWRATAPFKGIRGYHLNGIYCLFRPHKGFKTRLQEAVAGFLEAKAGGPEMLKVWTNTFLAETWAEDVEKLEAGVFSERVEEYTPDALPDQIALVIASVDVQGDRLEYLISGHGLDEESWGIRYGKIIGDPERDESWNDLKDVLCTTFKRRDGVELKITATAIDHRHRGDRVRKFIRKAGLPRIYPVYGTNGRQSLLVKPNHNKKYRMILYSVNTDSAKDTIFARLKLKDHGPRFMHFASANGFEPEHKFFDQLTSESVKLSYRKGFPIREYVKDPSARNEGLDLEVYTLAALDILKPNIKVIAEGLLAGRPPQERKTYELKDPNAAPGSQKAEEPQTPNKPAMQKNPKRRRRRMGGAGGMFNPLGI